MNENLKNAVGWRSFRSTLQDGSVATAPSATTDKLWSGLRFSGSALQSANAVAVIRRITFNCYAPIANLVLWYGQQVSTFAGAGEVTQAYSPTRIVGTTLSANVTSIGLASRGIITASAPSFGSIDLGTPHVGYRTVIDLGDEPIVFGNAPNPNPGVATNRIGFLFDANTAFVALGINYLGFAAAFEWDEVPIGEL